MSRYKTIQMSTFNLLSTFMNQRAVQACKAGWQQHTTAERYCKKHAEEDGNPYNLVSSYFYQCDSYIYKIFLKL